MGTKINDKWAYKLTYLLLFFYFSSIWAKKTNLELIWAWARVSLEYSAQLYRRRCRVSGPASGARVSSMLLMTSWQCMIDKRNRCDLMITSCWHYWGWGHSARLIDLPAGVQQFHWWQPSNTLCSQYVCVSLCMRRCVSLSLCSHSKSWTPYLKNRLWKFHQINNTDTVGDEDEPIISTSGLKSDVTIVFLDPDCLKDAKISAIRVHLRQM